MSGDACSLKDEAKMNCATALGKSVSLAACPSQTGGCSASTQSTGPRLHCGLGPHLNGPLVFCVNKSAPFAFVPVTKV